MLQMKQQLKEEQAKSKQKADEIAELRRYVCYEQQDSDNNEWYIIIHTLKVEVLQLQSLCV